MLVGLWSRCNRKCRYRTARERYPWWRSVVKRGMRWPGIGMFEDIHSDKLQMIGFIRLVVVWQGGATRRRRLSRAKIIRWGRWTSSTLQIVRPRMKFVDCRNLILARVHQRHQRMRCVNLVFVHLKGRHSGPYGSKSSTLVTIVV